MACRLAHIEIENMQIKERKRVDRKNPIVKRVVLSAQTQGRQQPLLPFILTFLLPYPFIEGVVCVVRECGRIRIFVFLCLKPLNSCSCG